MVFICAVLLFVFLITVKSNWFKGVIGEWKVNILINRFLDKTDYHLIKNVTLPTDNGTTQIDHIVVSPFGLFVIETKNMKGWIFGSEHQKQWTQKIYKYSGKFQNPLHQNYKHTKTLEACLNVPTGSIFSVIIFIGDSTFKTPMLNNVTFARGGIEYIKSKKNIVLSDNQVSEIINNIENERLTPGFKTNRQHSAHVKDIIIEKPNVNTCTKCGSAMILRQAKKGKNAGNEFWGCSAFPKCRHVQDV